MELESLLQSLTDFKVYGKKSLKISFLIDDSRKVKKGCLFVAVKGRHVDSHKFIAEAISKGVSAVAGEVNPKKDWLKKITYVKVINSREALSYLASKWYGEPSKKLKVIGVTGTDGKTTTASMIYWILKKAGKKVGLISTLGAQINGRLYDTGFHVTNPEPLALQEFLQRMVTEGCEYAVLEITSHGIDQKRIEGINFKVAVLTNITHEHTDYHGSFEEYRKIKTLFLKKADSIVLNMDDPSFAYVKKELTDRKNIITYSKDENSNYKASGITETQKGLNFSINFKGKREDIRARIEGYFNVDNILASFAVADRLGIPSKAIAGALHSFKLPLGRLEKIPSDRGFDIYIDFAHTPNALENVLSCLRRKTQGRLICIFGCAGERDFEKRRKMGGISAKICDVSVFTAEDPRSENVFAILSEMTKGAIKAGAKEIKFGFENKAVLPNKHLFAIVPERHEAIGFALNFLAKAKDCVLITGKGHEKSMAYGGIEHPWSDKETVESILNSQDKFGVIVLAAGKGKRMNFGIPKVLHGIAYRPMISYTLENLRKAGFSNITVTVGFKKEEVMKEVQGAVKFALQPEVLGTADAAKMGLAKVEKGIKTVLVLNGDDSAFYQPKTIKEVLNSHLKGNNVLTFVSLFKDNPQGLGRVVRDGKGNLVAIIEDRELTASQRKIKEVNDGLYVFKRSWLEENLKKVEKSSQGEYYLVDLIKIALSQKEKVNIFCLKDDSQWQGVNTSEQLKEADMKMKKRLRKWN